ncbi:hypothetical protein M5689_013325 [Euphorbia peplus]|nr:hypothetical protein M5689_013325 [Euphorbia peplus]
MERKYPPVKDPHASTADLLTWTEGLPVDTPSAASTQRSHDHWPAGKMSKVLYGGQATDEETETFNKKKPCSGYKLKEMNGSGIFAAKGSDGSHAGSANKTSVRTYQQAMNGMSQISFSTEEIISPKKPTSLPEVAKQRELSGTLQDADLKSKKQISNAKFKEISGHDIFAPSPEIVARPLAAARNLESKDSKQIEKPVTRRTSVKVSNPAGGQSNILFGEDPVVKSAKKIHNQKFQELTGNDIFKGDVPPGSAEKPLSSAKLKEISGSNIFADGKSESRDYFGGVRQSPGGNSSIALL